MDCEVPTGLHVLMIAPILHLILFLFLSLKSEFKRRKETDYTLVDGFGSEHGSGSYGRLNFSEFETIRNGKDASSFVRNTMFGA